jgi:excisionase family DNA binding protein
MTDSILGAMQAAVEAREALTKIIQQLAEAEQPEPQEKSTAYLTTDQVVELLQVSRSTLYQWVQEQKIPHFRLPNGKIRFQEKELVDWMIGRRSYKDE